MVNWLEKIGIRNIANIKEKKFVLIAGPCVIENAHETEEIAKTILEIADELAIPFVFKASYDKANRTSIDSYRGVDIKEGLAILHNIRSKYNIPVLSDVHSVEEVKLAEKVLDFIQIPALLSRQTDLIVEAARTNKIINIKKGQFLSPYDMKHVIDKVRSTGNTKYIITERGTSFGYNYVINDFSGFPIMMNYAPVIYDATHSAQHPGSKDGKSGGNRDVIPTLTRAAVAAGALGVYIEVHPEPEKALSDGPISFPLSKLKLLVEDVLAVRKVVKTLHNWENPIE